MLLYVFVGCLLPYIEVLDSWIFEGILDDPFEEVVFDLYCWEVICNYNRFRPQPAYTWSIFPFDSINTLILMNSGSCVMV